MNGTVTDLPTSHPPSRRTMEDRWLLVAWWFVIGCCITFFDAISSRAAFAPLYTIAVEHVWYAMAGGGAIGALSAERDKLLWFFISAVGGAAALAVMVVVVTLVSGLAPG